MANDEAAIVELLGKNRDGDPIRYTIVPAAITKGSLMKLTAAGNRLAALQTAADAFCGIAAEDTTVASGATTIAVYTNGLFEITAAAAGAANIGAKLATSATANMFTPANGAAILAGKIIGQAYEAADNDERIVVRVLPHGSI